MPVVLWERVSNPLAVLSLPVVLADSANQPCAVLFCPLVSRLSVAMPSAALLFFPRSSPTTVVGSAPARGAGEAAEQKSADARKIKASRCFPGRQIEVLISVFIKVFLFSSVVRRWVLGFSCVCFLNWTVVLG